MECPYDTAKANYRHAILKLKKVISIQDLAPNESWLEKSEESKDSGLRNEPEGG